MASRFSLKYSQCSCNCNFTSKNKIRELSNSVVTSKNAIVELLKMNGSQWRPTERKEVRIVR